MEKLTKTYWRKINLFENFFKFYLKKNRNLIYKFILDSIDYDNTTNFIDIGSTPDLGDDQNYFLKYLEKNKNVTILSNQNCEVLRKKFDNINKIYHVDFKENNLQDESFDIVHSGATIEHVGSFKDQSNFISECFRIAKKKVIITTPNRNYPIDFHTKIPLLHLLPKKVHRKILNSFGDKFFSEEENLNLLTKKDLNSICNELKIRNFKIHSHKLFSMSSNLILIIEK